MKKDKKEILIQEFIKEGASFEQARELAEFSQGLSGIVNVERPDSVKKNFLRQYKKENRNIWQKHYQKFLYAVPILLFLFIVFGTTVVKAQQSKPGDTLYPLKVLAEKVYNKIPYKFNLTQSSKNISDEEERVAPSIAGKKDKVIQKEDEKNDERIKNKKEMLNNAEDEIEIPSSSAVQKKDDDLQNSIQNQNIDKKNIESEQKSVENSTENVIDQIQKSLPSL